MSWQRRHAAPHDSQSVWIRRPAITASMVHTAMFDHCASGIRTTKSAQRITGHLPWRGSVGERAGLRNGKVRLRQETRHPHGSVGKGPDWGEAAVGHGSGITLVRPLCDRDDALDEPEEDPC